MNSLTLFSVIATLVVYIGAKIVSIRIPSPLTTPVFTGATVLIFLLIILRIPYETYEAGTSWLTSLLGPATVALAVPMYQNRKIISERLRAATFGLSIGILSTVVSAVWIAKAFGLSETIQATAAVKAVTTPVAIETVLHINGNPELAAAFVIIAGMLGAVFAPLLLTWMRITDPCSRGLSIGTVSHGIGTSQAALEGSIQGAASSIAMGIVAIITSIILPWLYPVIS